MFYVVKGTQIKASYISLDAPVNGFKIVEIPVTVKIDEEDPSPALFDADSMVNQKYNGLLVNDPSFTYAVWDEIGFEEPDVNENPASQLPFNLGTAVGGTGSGDEKFYLQGVSNRATQLWDGGANPLDGSTVTVDGKVYTFQTTLTDVDGNIQLDGADTDVNRDRLIAAINLTGVAGTDYATSMTIHPTVTASRATGVTVPTDFAVSVWAKTPGTAGNAIVVATDVVGAAWDAGTLAGGTDPLASLDSNTIDISADGAFDRFKVYWDVYSLTRTYDGNRTLLSHTAELPEMVNVSISNNGGATFTPVAHLTATTLAGAGTQLIVRFENTSQTRYYIGSFAILY